MFAGMVSYMILCWGRGGGGGGGGGGFCRIG